jgi:tetratricopeptide (TPR) repeat protein
MKHGLGLFIVTLALGAPAHLSAQSLPDAGLAAEAAGRWDDAIRAYRQVLDREPQRADVWVRIADVESTRNNLPAAIDALDHAGRIRPTDPSIFRKLSQAYAASDQPRPALEAIRVALALAPDNKEYLLATATLATWQGDYSLAARSYRRVQDLGGAGNDVDLALSLARVSAWAGETNQAVDAYRRYLAMQPDAADVWLELVRTEGWRGNYGAALEAAATYRARFGESPAYVREVAAIRARSGRPSEAVKLVEPLLKDDPSSHDLNVTRAVALTMQQRPREAFEALDSVRRINPTDRETQATEKLVRANLSSSVQPGYTYYSDSDDLQVSRFAPSGTVLFTSGTQLTIGYERQILDAPIRSGLGRADGGSAQYDYGWTSVSQKIGRVTVQGLIGTATSDVHRETPYAASARIQASDSLIVTAGSTHGFFVVSPRTLEIGLTERHHSLEADWAPGVLYRITGGASYQRLSDGNDRWQVLVNPRRALARRQLMNLDLGFSGYVLGTSFNLANGYYDPKRYESYAGVVYPYFKVSENVGVAATLAAGVQRESRFGSSFHFGGNASVDLSVGIYRPWVLKVTAAATNNQRADSGAFSGFSSGIVLIRRF